MLISRPSRSTWLERRKRSPRTKRTERKTRKQRRPRNYGVTRKEWQEGIRGPVGLPGEAGIKCQKGDAGPVGVPGTKGEPGESFSAPSVALSPSRVTVNESGSAMFQCSATGNPQPAVVWSKLPNQLQISKSAVTGGILSLQNVKGSDAGVYKCSAANVLGQAHALGRLVVNGEFS